MPIYEYRCQKCAHEYEKREGFDAPAQQRCPKCRGKALRVLQAAPIVFKGSGFYQTDYRSDAYKKAAEADHKSSDQKAEKTVKDKTKSGSTSSPGDTAKTKKKEGDSA